MIDFPVTQHHRELKVTKRENLEPKFPFPIKNTTTHLYIIIINKFNKILFKYNNFLKKNNIKYIFLKNKIFLLYKNSFLIIIKFIKIIL